MGKESTEELMLLNCGVEKALESPLDTKEIKPVNPKGNQSWILIRRTHAEAEAQYFGHLMQRTVSLEMTLMLGKIGGRKRGGQQRMGWLDGITDSMGVSLGELWELVNSGSWWWTGRPGLLWFMGLQRVGHDWVTELNWKMFLQRAVGVSSWKERPFPLSWGEHTDQISLWFTIYKIEYHWEIELMGLACWFNG